MDKRWITLDKNSDEYREGVKQFVLNSKRCDWANIVSGVKKEDGFTLVNLHDGLDKKDPFILASHAKQVFYSRESESSSWYVVLKAPPRGFHDLELFDESVFMSYVPQDVSALDIDNLDSDES
ncbi:hypothetical protein ACLB2K_029558 [Fragaria x ananassa]